MSIMPGLSLDDSSRRCFLASVDGRNIVVELDNAAALKLNAQAFDLAQARIEEAVRRLIDLGHVVERDGRFEVIVTALDL